MGVGIEFFPSDKKIRASKSDVLIYSGAGYEARTRYLHLGKVALYQMSYIRKLRLKIRRGASDRNRTNDTRIFSPLLYRLSYRGKKWRPGTGSNRRPLA